MDIMYKYIFLFFIFSFMGWIMEVSLKYRQYGRFINRGFFIGPILPIYGTGAVLITSLVEMISGVEKSVGTTFFISFFACGIVEYLASYYMEKKYHARWWDYSKKPMNLNGRVWIGNLILFGIGGVILEYFVAPTVFTFYSKFSPRMQIIIAVCMSGLFIADYITSSIVMKVIKTSVEESEADSTEKISLEVRMLLSNKNILYKRLANAYPDVVYKTKRIEEHLLEIKNETARLQKMAEERLNEASVYTTQLAKEVMPATLLKNSIIEDQNRLIQLLEEGGHEEEVKELRTHINHNLELLSKKTILSINTTKAE